jgi:hypothetical protein
MIYLDIGPQHFNEIKPDYHDLALHDLAIASRAHQNCQGVRFSAQGSAA